MSGQSILCYAGSISQTGQAVARRFPAVTIVPYSSFEEIAELLKTAVEPIAVPVWNSHKGEIRASEVWERVISRRACISDLWPSRIEFWLIIRCESLSKVKRVCSVHVAKEQCSKLLETLGVEFKGFDSTVEAFRAFSVESSFDAVLIAPDPKELSDFFSIATRETANPNNFTAFALLNARGRFGDDRLPEGASFTAVSMPAFRSSPTDDQREFFERLFQTAQDLDELPRLLFVFDRREEAASVGLLFQGPVLMESDLLSADIMEKDEIQVIEEAGNSSAKYVAELHVFLAEHFPALQDGDFIKHRGDNAWLFACPTLGIYTHGYDEEVVESAFRYYVTKVFSLLSDGLQCTPAQRLFFAVHESHWQERDTEFIEFKLVA